jgi:hypothetical protein
LSKKAHKDNIQYYFDCINSDLDKASRARTNKDWLLRSAESNRLELNSYISNFKTGFRGTNKQKELLSNSLSGESLELLLQIKEIEHKKAIAAKKRASKKRFEEHKQALKNWQNGLTNYFSSIFFDEAYLRISNDGLKVETSQGSKVSIEAAKLLYKMIKAGKDIKGHNIDGFKVISINGTLKIGCHVINIESVHKIGKQLTAGNI